MDTNSTASEYLHKYLNGLKVQYRFDVEPTNGVLYLAFFTVQSLKLKSARILNNCIYWPGDEYTRHRIASSVVQMNKS